MLMSLGVSVNGQGWSEGSVFRQKFDGHRASIAAGFVVVVEERLLVQLEVAVPEVHLKFRQTLG